MPGQIADAASHGLDLQSTAKHCKALQGTGTLFRGYALLVLGRGVTVQDGAQDNGEDQRRKSVKASQERRRKTDSRRREQRE